MKLNENLKFKTHCFYSLKNSKEIESSVSRDLDTGLPVQHFGCKLKKNYYTNISQSFVPNYCISSHINCFISLRLQNQQKKDFFLFTKLLSSRNFCKNMEAAFAYQMQHIKQKKYAVLLFFVAVKTCRLPSCGVFCDTR